MPMIILVSSDKVSTLIFVHDTNAGDNVFTDTYTGPSLWVGTSLGTVLVISLTLPTESDVRRREPVIVSPSGE